MTMESREILSFKVHLIPEIDIGLCSTILTAYWDQPAPSFFNGSEDTPEYDRRKKVSVGIYRSVDIQSYPLATL